MDNEQRRHEKRRVYCLVPAEPANGICLDIKEASRLEMESLSKGLLFKITFLSPQVVARPFTESETFPSLEALATLDLLCGHLASRLPPGTHRTRGEFPLQARSQTQGTAFTP